MNTNWTTPLAEPLAPKAKNHPWKRTLYRHAKQPTLPPTQNPETKSAPALLSAGVRLGLTPTILEKEGGH